MKFPFGIVIGFVISTFEAWGQDVCSGTVCRNGGTCFVAFDQSASLPYICNCPPQYEGLHCEEYTQESASPKPNLCASNPCLNGATCVNTSEPAMLTSVLCHCAPGYVGYFCDRIDTGRGDCDPNPCENDGMCDPTPFSIQGYTCECQHGYIGDRCEDLVSGVQTGCATSPCMNGAQCIDQPKDNDYFCNCLVGYSGRNCQVEGPCIAEPCSNGGTCQEESLSPAGFHCLCTAQYYGVNCTEAYQEHPCDPSPCENGALCFQLQETEPDLSNKNSVPFYCACTPGFIGTRCQIPDPCFSGPCLNGGSCTQVAPGGSEDLVQGFWCDCPSDFMGPTCADPGPCSSGPCLNGGNCANVLGVGDPVFEQQLASYLCSCHQGWSGLQCETAVPSGDTCASNPCLNGGTCKVSANNFYSCDCPADHVGDVCQYRDPCLSNPCWNGGQCYVSSVGDSFLCQCSDPFFGEQCDSIDGAACPSQPCQNGGTCNYHSHTNTYTCLCPIAYIGTNCETRDPCLSNPCQNGGQCYVSSMGDSFLCQCSESFIGERCESIVATCQSHPCQNGGTCIFNSTTDSHACLCPAAFFGTNCEIRDPCYPMPCHNNGECWRNAESTAFICQCAAGFSGALCNIRVSTASTSVHTTTEAQKPNLCVSNPCASGSTCVTEGPDQDGNYFAVCLCPLGFTGVTCGIELPPTVPCLLDPCYNGGTCSSSLTSMSGFICTCPEGYIGNRCETDLNQGETSAQPTSIEYNFPSTEPTLTEPPARCASDPCLNGGTCVESHSIYVCFCPTFFVGDHCEMDIRDCSYGDRMYKEGQHRDESCGKCVCQNGDWQCSAHMCDCHFGAEVYMNNETWLEDCNTCSCYDGVSVCSNIDCSTVCLFEGKIYDIGAQRDDRCTTCICQFGRWYCANIEDCVDNSCVYNESVHEEKAIRPHNCNLCTCLEGNWQCSTRKCEDIPEINEITVEFIGDPSPIYGQETHFFRYFKSEVSDFYHLGDEQIQHSEVINGSTEGRFRLRFRLMKNVSYEISVEVVSDFIRSNVTSGQFILRFEGQKYVADPLSFTVREIMINDLTPAPTMSSNSNLIIVIVGSVLGVSMILTFVSICFCFYFARSKKESTVDNNPLDLQQFPGQTETPPSSPVSLIQKSRSVPAHYRFRNPFI